MFCSNCGEQVKDGDKFCNNCGNPLQTTVTPQRQPPPPQSRGEQITGVIEGCKHGFPAGTYTLFITAQRIIAAKTGGITANLTGAGAATGGIVGGLLGAGIDAHTRGKMSKKTAEYYSMSMEQMLTKNKKNFAMYLANIQSVELKAPGFLGQGEIKFRVGGKDKRFMLNVSKDIFNTYPPMLVNVLPGRVHVK